MKVSAIGLGGWLTYGGSVEEERAIDCIHTALDEGIIFFDCADVYAKGESELVMGKALEGVRRSDIVLSSKLFGTMSQNPNDRGLSRKHLFESVEKSLERLGTDYLDIYYCHRYDPETPLEETVRAMEDIIRMGLVHYWGTSVWEAAQIEDAVGLAHKHNAYAPQAEQPCYNLLERDIEAEVLPMCAQYGIGVTVWSPLAQGALTGKYDDGVPKGSRAEMTEFLTGYLGPDNLPKAKALNALAREAGMEPAVLALAWVLRLPEISSAITGASAPEHVRTSAKAAGAVLEEDLLARIEEILNPQEG